MPNVFERTVLISGQVSDAKRRKKFASFFGEKNPRLAFTDREVTAMSRNTNDLMEHDNRRPPIKFGHWDDDQERKGEFLNTFVRRIKMRSGKSRNSLVVRFQVNDKFADTVNEKLLPDQSIEFEDTGDLNDEEGKMLPMHLTGLALLGTDTGAYAGLPKEFASIRNFSSNQLRRIEGKMAEPKKGLFGNLFNKTKKFAEIPNDIIEECLRRTMLIQELSKKAKDSDDPSTELDEINEHGEWLQDKFEASLGDEPEVEEEETQDDDNVESELKGNSKDDENREEDEDPDEEDEDEKLAKKDDEDKDMNIEVEKKLQKMQDESNKKFDMIADILLKKEKGDLDDKRVKLFDSLVKDGHLHKDDTKFFNSMATTEAGLEGASKFFGKYQVETPSTTEVATGSSSAVMFDSSDGNIEKVCFARIKELYPDMDPGSDEFKDLAKLRGKQMTEFIEDQNAKQKLF